VIQSRNYTLFKTTSGVKNELCNQRCPIGEWVPFKKELSDKAFAIVANSRHKNLYNFLMRFSVELVQLGVAQYNIFTLRPV
jgi:hypothetical protein